jgi:hypothetical protein
MTVPIYAVGLVISNLVCYSSYRLQEKVRLPWRRVIEQTPVKLSYASRGSVQRWHICVSTALSAASFIVCLVVKQASECSEILSIRENISLMRLLALAIRYVFICFGGAFLWAAQPLYLSFLAPYFPDRHERAVVIALGEETVLPLRQGSSLIVPQIKVNGIGNLASVYG